MEELEWNDPLWHGLDRGYADQWELLRDQMSLLDHRLYLYYKYHQWLGPDNELRNMLGFVVTREEFEHNMLKAAQVPLAGRLEQEEAEQLACNRQGVALRLARTDRSSMPLLQLFDRFGLDEFEQDCVLLAYLGQVEEKYEKLFAYLQDDISRKAPTLSLAVALFAPPGQWLPAQRGRLSGRPFAALFSPTHWAAGELVLAGEVLDFLNGSLHLPAGLRLLEPMEGEEPAPLLIQQELGAGLDRLFSLPRGLGLLWGRPGSGRSFQVAWACRRQGRRCLFADLTLLGRTEEQVARAAMLARLTDSCLCLSGLESTGEEGEPEPPTPRLAQAVSGLEPSRWPLFVCSEQPLHLESDLPALELELPLPSPDQRLTLFRAALSGVPLAPEVSLEEVAAKFHFTPCQVEQAARQARGLARVTGQRLDMEQLHRCCYRQVVHKLDRLAVRVRPGHSWEELILPEEQKRLIGQACAHVRHRHRVYSQWGFERKVSYGRGLSVLFAGVPGTGKTLCAQIMARELNMEMYKINISQIVSKYIGETEKNLQAVFREARHSNCILFFDECDALFGKRSEVKDSHDRNANVETAYLLQQIEDYDGVCVLATNLIQNIDEAFLRRITFVIHFPFPDAPMRRRIYQGLVAAGAPLDEDIDWDFLAEKFRLSGGYIKNIVVAAAFLAAEADAPIGMRHLLNAAVNEMKKNEIVVVREELREYADLLD